MAEGNSQGAVRLNREGLSLLDEDRIEEAIEAFTQAIEADPNYAPAYINRAACLRKLGKEEEARRDNVLYNTLSVGGHFTRTRPGDRFTVVAPDPTEDGGPVTRPGPSSAPSTEESEQEAGPAQSTATDQEPTSPQSTGPEVEVTDAHIHPPPPRGFGRGRGQRARVLDRGAGKEVAPGNDGSTAGDLRVSVRRYTTDLGDPPAGAWVLNRWGLRDGITAWSIERFFRTVFLITALGVVGVLIARVAFCPEGLTSSFWTGCWEETLGLGLGGALLGGLISLLVTRGLTR